MSGQMFINPLKTTIPRTSPFALVLMKSPKFPLEILKIQLNFAGSEEVKGREFITNLWVIF